MKVRERVVGLAITHSYAYYRRILDGITSFAESRPNWRFVSLSPSADHSKLAEFKHVDVAIVDVASRELAEELERARVKIVNIACVVPELRIPPRWC